MEIAFISLIVVLIVLLVLQEYRHKQDRTDYKELAFNQQNQIKDLLEIVRWRSGMPQPSAKTEETRTNSGVPPIPNLSAAVGNPFLPTDPPVHQTVTKKPLGRAARIAAQEEEEQNEMLQTG